MKVLSLVTVWGVFLALSASPLEVKEVDRQIIFHTFNAQYHKADSLLKRQVQQFPDHPKYYYLSAWSSFYSRYFANSGISWNDHLQITADYARKAVEVAETLEKTPEIKFYLGSAYGFLSRTHMLLDESYFEAYFAARKSRNYLQEVLEEAPDIYDAYLGLAVLEYFTATRLSGWRNSLAWILGMAGDREKALKYFTLVEQEGSLCKEEAQFIMSMMYRYLEPNPDVAEEYLKILAIQYPDNNWIKDQYNSLQIIKIVDQKGVDFLATHIDSLINHFGIRSDNLLNTIGYNFINTEDYQSALTILKLNVELFPEVANCYDSLGECYMHMGNNADAIKNYQLAYQKLDSDITLDEEDRESLRENIETQLKKLNAL